MNLRKDSKISDNNDALNLLDFINMLWKGKYTILITTTFFAVMSVLYALSLPNQYKSSVLLAPAQQNSGGLSGLGQLGGIASLAGMQFGRNASNESFIAQEIMKSWSFIEMFIVENNLAYEIVAVKGWDEEKNELEIDPDIFDLKKNEWVSVDQNTGKPAEPSSWDLYKAFSSRVIVSEDKKTGFVLVTAQHHSPYIAKKWLDLYVKSINRRMQERKTLEARRNISYLENQIEKTSITEMREVFYTVIEDQIKSKMLAEASPDYAFVPVNPSMVPEKKSSPQRALICIVGTLLGGTLSVIGTLIFQYTRFFEA